jgi:hypothetical protein
MSISYEPVLPSITGPQFNEKEHSYRWKDWILPSVSHILEETGIREPFDTTYWKRSLIRKGFSDEEAEEEMERVRNEATHRGTLVHLGIEHRCQGREYQPPMMVGSEEILEQFMPWFEKFAEEYELGTVYLTEQALIQPVGHYCGTVDCVAETKLGLMAIDWKTIKACRKGKREKWQKYQLAAYVGAINCTFDLEVLQAMNVQIGPDGFNVVVHEPNELLSAWTTLKGLLKDYWEIRHSHKEYHSPGLAAAALQTITETWGPWEEQ